MKNTVKTPYENRKITDDFSINMKDICIIQSGTLKTDKSKQEKIKNL
ncbi:hypothetical protein CHRY9393_02125 [Chryseobacterium fistulae]|uniref:Uncharacterized protein n=2 Tax=Chryseobacterium TaxID=59732 RepID=A0A6N4X3V5_9FLAO|nr:hypothetical protein CHRY9293_00959 [Chryseobacterium potabilaquae]CAA7389341.1 hypothetical protein CHRY9393_02125 [Chryseobacterium fistulae]